MTGAGYVVAMGDQEEESFTLRPEFQRAIRIDLLKTRGVHSMLISERSVELAE